MISLSLIDHHFPNIRIFFFGSCYIFIFKFNTVISSPLSTQSFLYSLINAANLSFPIISSIYSTSTKSCLHIFCVLLFFLIFSILSTSINSNPIYFNCFGTFLDHHRLILFWSSRCHYFPNIFVFISRFLIYIYIFLQHIILVINISTITFILFDKCHQLLLSLTSLFYFCHANKILNSHIFQPFLFNRFISSINFNPFYFIIFGAVFPPPYIADIL